MRALQAVAHSEGKGHRNDDFKMVQAILSTRMLVLVGDFTSDSPKGANQTMELALEGFIEKRLKTWREHLIPPEDILGLIARFVNRELQQSRDAGQTTLCACMIDSYEQSLYFVNVGDSGFGIAHEPGFQFLRKGDVVGSRDASGFLPVKAESFPIAKAAFPQGARLLLFTDGFWENTAHFLSEAQAESKLSQIFATGSLSEIAASFKQQILEPSNRRDDFTFVIVKEEPVAHKDGDRHQPSMEQVEAIIEKKVFEAFDQQDHQKPVPPSPMEQEFLRLLGQTANGLQGMEKRVLAAVRESQKKHHQRLARELKGELDVHFQKLENLRDDLERTRADLADQDFKFERRFEESEGLFGVQAVAAAAEPVHTGSTGNMQAENRLLSKLIEDVDINQLREVNFEALEPRLAALEAQAGLVNAPQQDAQDPLDQPPSVSQNLKHLYARNKWIWQAINSVLLLLVLGFLLFRGKPQPLPASTQTQEPVPTQPVRTQVETPENPQDFETLKRGSVDARQSFLVTWPQNLRPIQPPRDLLAFMGLSPERAQTELICLANALARAKAPMRAASQGSQEIFTINVPLEGCTIAGKTSFPLYIRSGNSPANKTVLLSWQKPFVSGDGVFPNAQNIRAVWLQIHGDARQIDGAFGNNSRDALTIVLQNRLASEKLSAFQQSWETWLAQQNQAEVPASLIQSTAAFFNLNDPELVKKGIQEVGETLKQDQSYWRGKEVFIPQSTASFINSRKVLAKNGEVTPLGQWWLEFVAKANAPAGPPYLVWLADRLGLAEADGSATTIRQTLNHLKSKELKKVLQDTTSSNSKWGTP